MARNIKPRHRHKTENVPDTTANHGLSAVIPKFYKHTRSHILPVRALIMSYTCCAKDTVFCYIIAHERSSNMSRIFFYFDYIVNFENLSLAKIIKNCCKERFGIGQLQ